MASNHIRTRPASRIAEDAAAAKVCLKMAIDRINAALDGRRFHELDHLEQPLYYAREQMHTSMAMLERGQRVAEKDALESLSSDTAIADHYRTMADNEAWHEESRS